MLIEVSQPQILKFGHVQTKLVLAKTAEKILYIRTEPRAEPRDVAFSAPSSEETGFLVAGDEGRQLLDGDGFARVQKVIHFSQSLLAVVVLLCQCLLILFLLLVLGVVLIV